MRRFVTGLFVLALLASRGRGQDLAALKKEHDDAAKKYQAQLNAAKPAERAELAKNNPSPSFVPRFVAFAEKNAKHPDAVEALIDALRIINATGRAKEDIWAKTIAILARDHVKNASPKVEFAVHWLSTASDPISAEFIRAVMDQNPTRKNQARACKALATANKTMAGLVEKMKADNAVRERIAMNWGKDCRDKLASLDPDKLKQEAEDLAKILETRYADVITVITIGRPAPEVVIKDIDGKEAKLSALKGKVVVLDIWATWCGPCRAMIPHEREMVKKLKDKAFALVSISADEKLETLKNFVAKEPMPWTHWHNGSTGGIVEAWGVTYYPTIYILDHKGVIRFKDLRGKAMEEAVEKLLKEMNGKTS